MESILGLLSSYWWAIPLLLCAIMYKWALRFLFGMVIVPEDKIGLIIKKFVLVGKNRALPDGAIIALNGEPGFQAKTLAPGLYFFYFPWQYSIHLQPFIEIQSGKIGLIIAKDGKPLSNPSI